MKLEIHYKEEGKIFSIFVPCTRVSGQNKHSIFVVAFLKVVLALKAVLFKTTALEHTVSVAKVGSLINSVKSESVTIEKNTFGRLLTEP